ncbi:MAG: SufE family protein [Chlamydiae bacterium]|nr:SufE family protein [Chlamydiota bacterium]
MSLDDLYKKKHEALLSQFPARCSTQVLYERLLAFGKNLPPLEQDIREERFLVEGCQSEAYLRSHLCSEGRIWYEVQTEALLSAGLMALLLAIYHGEPVDLILSYPPLFLQELNLAKHLSPGRSHGLASLYKRMKQDAFVLQWQAKLTIST